MSRVLVACEFSGRVRDAFTRAGHTAYSCDLLPTDSPGLHYQQPISLDMLYSGWNLMIAFPPCTHLAVSGARWFKDKQDEQAQALEFVEWLMAAPIPHIAIENPIGVISSRIRKPDQIIQPWQFGDEYQKSTCLWLKNLPKLKATNVVSAGEFVIHGGRKLPKWYSNREMNRNLTFQGIADAMAEQWGGLL